MSCNKNSNNTEMEEVGNSPPSSPLHVSNEDAVSVAPSSTASIKLDIDENTSTFKLVVHILILSVPLGIASVAQISVGSVLVALVGRMVGVEQLGATSLAFGLLYCTAFSLAAGCCGALETMLSYTYGKDPHSKMYGVYCQRMILLLLIIAVIVGPILAYADFILIEIGQNPVVAYYTGVFCRIALAGVFPAMLLEVVRRYFACQHLNNPLSVNLVAAALIFPFLVFGLISVMGFPGAPMAWVILQTLMPTSLIVYLYYTKIYKKNWAGWDRNALCNWGPMCKLAFPSMAMQLSEWGSLEINALTAGFASPPQLAAFSTIYMVSGIMWSFSSGLYIMVAVLVGKSIGEKRNQLARRCAHICLLLTMCFGVLDILILLIFKDYIPRIFSTNEETLAAFPKLLPFFFVYHFFDLFQSCMMGVLRGCGMQTIGAVAITLVFTIVGVPLGIIVFFTTNLGVASLWLGPGIGVSLVGFPIYIYLLFFHIKWDSVTLPDDEAELNLSDEERTWRATNPQSERGSDDESADDGDGGSHLDNTSFIVQHRGLLVHPTYFHGTDSTAYSEDTGVQKTSNASSPNAKTR